MKLKDTFLLCCSSSRIQKLTSSRSYLFIFTTVLRIPAWSHNFVVTTMRIFGWVQNKFNGKQEEKKRCDSGCSSTNLPVPADGKEEVSQWPNAFLSIGTLGNQDAKEDQKRAEHSEDLDSLDDIADITVEEVCKLQKELKVLLKRKRKSFEFTEDERGNLPLNKFLNCPSSLELDRAETLEKSEDVENESFGDLSRDSRLILNKVKELLLGNRKSIKKKSTSFLLKKFFFCSSGFAPAPSLRDPIPESRIDKILRTILTKKIYPQSSPPVSAKKYLVNKIAGKKSAVDYEDEKKDQSKWVKTDSEYIVLEI